MLFKFQKLQTEDRELNQVQDNIARSFTPLVNNPFLNGLILKKVALVSGANTVNHLLGRALQGWLIVRQRGAASVYDTQDTNTLTSKNLNLTASAPVTCDIYVF